MREIWAEEFQTADLTSPNKSYPFKFSEHTVVKAVRTWVISYNDPTFTSLVGKIYSVRGASKAASLLVATSSNTQIKAEIVSTQHSLTEVYFEFDEPIQVEKNTWRCFSIQGSDYTYSLASHLAWVKAWPKSVHRDDQDEVFPDFVLAPYQVHLIGCKKRILANVRTL